MVGVFSRLILFSSIQHTALTINEIDIFSLISFFLHISDGRLTRKFALKESMEHLKNCIDFIIIYRIFAVVIFKYNVNMYEHNLSKYQ